MHYQNGREAKVGDTVVGRDWSGAPVSGVVVETIPGADACNIKIVAMPAHVGLLTYSSNQFNHLDDAVPKPAQ